MTLEYPGIEGNGEIYLDVMKAICGDTSDKSMLDLGCHHAPYTPLLGFKERTYVDVLDRGLDHKEEQQYFVKADVHMFCFNNNHRTWDVIIASDFIEHLSKQSGHDLCWSMRLLSKKYIIFTPLGDLLVDKEADHPDAHKSGWAPTDLTNMEYAFISFPAFHKQFNCGAFFAWHCENIKEDFERVTNELKNKSWAL
jgi:hypothetical protein